MLVLKDGKSIPPAAEPINYSVLKPVIRKKCAVMLWSEYLFFFNMMISNNGFDKWKTSFFFFAAFKHCTAMCKGQDSLPGALKNVLVLPLIV